MIHTNMMTITHVSGLPACKLINNGVVLAIVPDSTKEAIQLEKPVILTRGNIGIEFIPNPELKPLVIKLTGKSPSKASVKKAIKKLSPYLSLQ
jgi:hypothetical protein